MIGYQTTTLVISLMAITVIVWLIRRDHLHPRKAFWWLLVVLAVGALGVFPEIADWVATRLGISYSPTLIFVVAFIVLLVKLLKLDIARTREQQTVLILSQRLSVLETRFENRLENSTD